LNSKAKFESGSSYCSLKRSVSGAFNTGFDWVNPHRPTMVHQLAAVPRQEELSIRRVPRPLIVAAQVEIEGDVWKRFITFAFQGLKLGALST
jgi:hypothetical protein